MKITAFYNGLITKLGKADFEKVHRAKIGIAGAGGLGSNCALALVRAGVKHLTIVDFDIIEPTNLDRQFFFIDQVGMVKVQALKTNLLRINPELEINAVNKKIEAQDVASLFGNCDAIAECFDSAQYKSMLVFELLKLGKFTVAVSGLGGIGSSDQIITHRIKKNLVMIGDLKSDISSKPALSPRVSVAAAKQADTILEFILEKKFKKTRINVQIGDS